ncbi:MAG: glycosyltransferase [Gemmatimonadales bacterium]
MLSILLAAALAAAPSSAARPPVSPATPASISRAAFHDAMRQLWEDHITWTRLYIVSAAAGLPDEGAAAQRLLQNQADIGDAIKTFYGDAAGNGLTALLRSHILTAAKLVGAAKSGDTATVRIASAQWYANADSIATLLSSANPRNWPVAALQAAMRMHLDLTLKEATARLPGDWAGDIAAYDAVHQHILQMADVLSDGIIKQFPSRFN